ncbi:hypothetical protein GPA10_22255 [Streptomyces sp. p1417]|uniref:Uncharacterized protein n=1 Tax=Streptomyces typhae TaxID=2681492 RepID=A0A6L6X0W1_9ACTN|nr:hypothetical protein [Streptomyces typhae]MVO87411.1 hypothetical protein [Streptomyces typhae]
MREQLEWVGGISEEDRRAHDCQGTWDAQAVKIRADYRTLGVLILYTRGTATEWVDLIISDLALELHTAQRILALEAELGARLPELEIARTWHGHGHAEILGSSSFTIIRLSNLGARPIER